MSKKYDLLIYIGRFQPFHLAHQQVCEHALTLAENLAIFVGSANVHPSTKNPWRISTRNNHILTSLKRDCGVQLYPLRDYLYNDTEWLKEVNKLINGLKENFKKIGIIGFNKDASSYYLKMFPEINVELIPTSFGTLNATQIREQYFQDVPIISEFLPEPVRQHLKNFAFTEQFKWLLNEFKYIRNYKKIWENSPYQPTFITVDPVVTQSGNILLVKRKEPPFSGCYALPGGFINPKETLINAVVRELKEETRIADNKGEIPPAILKSFIQTSKVYDDPDRSERGRVITHAYHFELPKKSTLYSVRGDDDAETAHWINLAELKTSMFMEDHGFIIQDILNIKF